MVQWLSCVVSRTRRHPHPRRGHHSCILHDLPNLGVLQELLFVHGAIAIETYPHGVGIIGVTWYRGDSHSCRTEPRPVSVKDRTPLLVIGNRVRRNSACYEAPQLKFDVSPVTVSGL
jgi:hypothetical protein